MAKLGLKSKLLELLRETPIVTFACKKVGLNPSTFYEWHKNDLDFRNQADEVLIIGKRHINDMCKATIIKEIDKGNMRAVVFWLEHNDPDYRPVRTTYVDPINHTHQLEPGEVCKNCGFREPVIEEYKKNKRGTMDNKTLARELFKRVRASDKRKRNQEEMMEMIEDFIEANNIENKITFIDGSVGNDKPKFDSKIEWVITDGEKEEEDKKDDTEPEPETL